MKANRKKLLLMTLGAIISPISLNVNSAVLHGICKVGTPCFVVLHNESSDFKLCWSYKQTSGSASPWPSGNTSAMPGKDVGVLFTNWSGDSQGQFLAVPINKPCPQAWTKYIAAYVGATVSSTGGGGAYASAANGYSATHNFSCPGCYGNLTPPAGTIYTSRSNIIVNKD